MRTHDALLATSRVVACFALIGLSGTRSTAQDHSSAPVDRSPAAKPTPPPPSNEGPVTTVVFDFDVSGSQLHLRSDNATGAGQASYSTIKGKGNGYVVFSSINTDGWWFLTFTEESGRKLWLTPNQPIDGVQPAAPPAGYYVPQKTYSVCRDQSGNTVPYWNLVNGSNDCSLSVNFGYGGILYKLLMRPGALDATLCPTEGCPATGVVKVVCNAVSNNQCVSWTIAPNSGAPLVGVANLYRYGGPRGSEWIYVGQYYNTFRIDAAKP